MKKLLLAAALMLFALPAYGQNVTPGSIERLTDVTATDWTFSDLTATTADINGGTIDGATVGASSATTGEFTTLGFTALSDGATEAEVNRPADISARAVSPDATCTVTAAANEGRITYLSADGESQTCTLPDAGTATGGVYRFVVLNAPDGGTDSITIQVASGDNSVFEGTLITFDSTGGINYGSTTLEDGAQGTGGSDTITLNSTGVKDGDWIEIYNGENSVWQISGFTAFASQGSNNGGQAGFAAVAKFSSSVTSVD